MMKVWEPARGGPGRAFVGRDRELADLVAGLDDAIAGRVRLVLIAGEPGIGKTWLAEHLAEHAAKRGARVLWVRCWEGGGAPPFWPWAQLLRVLAEGLDDRTLAAWLGARAAQVAQLLPGLAERLGAAALPPGPARASEAARFVLFEAVTRFLRQAAATQPLMMVMEDLQAADTASLLLLEFLARDLRGGRLLVMGDLPQPDGGARARVRRHDGPAGPGRPSAHAPGLGPRGGGRAHRGHLRDPAVGGDGGRRPRGDRGQPAVRPRDRAAAGHRCHTSGPGPPPRALVRERPDGHRATAGTAVRRRRPGAVGGGGGGPGVRPVPGQCRLRAADRADPHRAVGGGGPGRGDRSGRRSRPLPLLPLPDPRGAL